MIQKRRIPSNKELLIQRWQDRFTNRTHLTFKEFLDHLHEHVRIKYPLSMILISMKSDLRLNFFLSFSVQVLLETFFHLFDRDSSGLLSESEWIGSVYKVVE